MSQKKKREKLRRRAVREQRKKEKTKNVWFQPHTEARDAGRQSENWRGRGEV